MEVDAGQQVQWHKKSYFCPGYKFINKILWHIILPNMLNSKITLSSNRQNPFVISKNSHYHLNFKLDLSLHIRLKISNVTQVYKIWQSSSNLHASSYTNINYTPFLCIKLELSNTYRKGFASLPITDREGGYKITSDIAIKFP